MQKDTGNLAEADGNKFFRNQLTYTQYQIRIKEKQEVLLWVNLY